MQGRSSSDEDTSDEDESSSGNDSDMGRAISANIMGGEGVEPPPPATPAPPTASTSGVDVKRNARCKCMRGDYIDNFGGTEVLLTRTINAGLEKEMMDLLLLGKVSTFIRRGGTTGSQKKRVHERMKVRCKYTHEGKIHGFHTLPISTEHSDIRYCLRSNTYSVRSIINTSGCFIMYFMMPIPGLQLGC